MTTLLELAKTEVTTGFNSFMAESRSQYVLSKAKANTGNGFGVNLDPVLQLGVDLYKGLAGLLKDESEPLVSPPPNGEGFCPQKHSVAWSWEAIGSQGWRGLGPNYFTGYPPFIPDLINPGETDKDGNVNGSKPKCGVYYQTRNSDGTYSPTHTGYEQFSFLTSNRNGAFGWLRACKAGGAPSTSKTQPAPGFGELKNSEGGDGSNFGCSVAYGTTCDNGQEYDPTYGTAPPNPVYPVQIGPNSGNLTFGNPYFDRDGNLRIPFIMQGDDWALAGSVNTSDGSIDFGLGAEGGNSPDGDGDGGDGSGDDSCVKQRICGETDSETNGWPITVPDLLTVDDSATYDIESLPQAIAWLARNIDAISGQYPITLEIEDTDPITRGNQSETIKLPNQAEAMAELFGLAYEANTNSELAVNMIFRLIPEVIAAKNSSLTAQDYIQAVTNWLGFRTKNVQREVDSNFNPLTPESLVDFLNPSKYKVQGVEDDDPHTLVEWVQQFKYAAGLVKASLFRGADLEGNLTDEVQSVVDNQPEDSSESWEKFIDALNRAESNLTDRSVSPRPRATSVDNALDIGTVLPDRPNE
ncbi:hypothetical protein [cf. Phormidesmis sp. LEGE 11477]|uniref:hypothetical protein n=1 Tax=cf. Phormidesmis sp. LEGE 11477 TaxID=1828680 RepID=UPI0018803A83|nr:hypothetical protein [cf. Phormidesmis sp. LEGE 11477]MBE9061855.1 hypothetical protein [cf. Phormidesmis sp. LEGE 11477]